MKSNKKATEFAETFEKNSEDSARSVANETPTINRQAPARLHASM